MADSIEFRDVATERPAEASAAIHRDLQTMLSGPGNAISETESPIQLAQYYGSSPPSLRDLLIQELQGGRGNSRAPQSQAEALCEARHMTFNECYDFKRLNRQDQYDYDHLRSDRDREDFLRDKR